MVIVYKFTQLGASEMFPRLIRKHAGTRWRNWLRHCTTGRKAAGSIPDGVIGLFH